MIVFSLDFDNRVCSNALDFRRVENTCTRRSFSTKLNETYTHERSLLDYTLYLEEL